MLAMKINQLPFPTADRSEFTSIIPLTEAAPSADSFVSFQGGAWVRGKTNYF